MIIRKKLTVSIFLSILIFFNYAKAQDKELTELFPIEQNNKWGFIDKSGRVIIVPRFDNERSFSEGLAAVKIGDKWGYINKSGEIIIKPRFESAGLPAGWPPVGSFSEGLASVRIGVKWGYIDKTGNLVIDPTLTFAYEFSEGLALVSRGKNRDGAYIDKNGKIIIDKKFDVSHLFREGLAATRINNKWGYLDKTGDWAIAPIFDMAGSFHEGFAAVCLDNKCGFIDETGKLRIPFRFDLGTEAGGFSEGLTPVLIGADVIDGHSVGGKWGFIDKIGKWVIQPQYDYALPFSEGLALVRFGNNGFPNNRWGYVNKVGDEKIRPNFFLAYDFKGGLAEVHYTGGWGYIDKAGKFVWRSMR